MKPLLFMIIALLLAVGFSLPWQQTSFEEQLTHLRFSQLEGIDPRVKQQPTDIQALLLNYADSPVLLLQAQAALLDAPTLAARILRLYGDNTLFQESLARYGSSILLPIDYFLQHDITTLDIMQRANHTWAQLKQILREIWDNDSAAPPVDDNTPLTPEQRGEFAIGFIHAEGHRFLSQFVRSSSGATRWITTQRIVEGTADFLVGGIRELESKQKTEQPAHFADYGWAALDALVIATPVFGIARLGAASKATEAGFRSAKPLRLEKTHTLTRITKGTLGKSLRLIRQHPLKSTLAAAALLALHPSLLNALLDTLATSIGWSPWVVKMLVWTLLWLPLLYLGLRLWHLLPIRRRQAAMPPTLPDG